MTLPEADRGALYVLLQDTRHLIDRIRYYNETPGKEQLLRILEEKLRYIEGEIMRIERVQDDVG